MNRGALYLSSVTPTDIGAPVGLAMPEYKGGDVEVDVVKIK